jgi:hypothetical protein
MKESIRKILREETAPIQIRRRLGLINQLIDVAINNMYVCDYEDENHFIKGVTVDLYWLVRDDEFGLTELDWMDVYRFLETHRTDDIKEYFNERKEGCIDDLNESKDKKLLPPKKNYLKIIESLIEPFKDEVGVCDITVLYNKYVDMYSIYFILGVNEMDTMFSHYNPSGREKYARELRNKVKNDIKGYLTIPNIYVGSYTSYECGDNSDLFESITGVTLTDTTQQLINKPVKLIGDVNTNTMIQNVNVNKDGSVNITFKNGMNVNTSLPMLRTFNVGVSIPLEFKIKKKTIVTESNTNNEKSFKTLENTVQKFININLDDYNVPSDLYDVVVDVTNDPYGRLECNVSFLFKKPFSLNDSNKLHHILKEIKKEIVNYFGDTFYHISSGVSTVDIYNDSKSRDKK